MSKTRVTSMIRYIDDRPNELAFSCIKSIQRHSDDLIHSVVNYFCSHDTDYDIETVFDSDFGNERITSKMKCE